MFNRAKLPVEIFFFFIILLAFYPRAKIKSILYYKPIIEFLGKLILILFSKMTPPDFVRDFY